MCFSVASPEQNSPPSADGASNGDWIHSLFDHSVCQWPGCDTLCKDLSSFVRLVGTSSANRAWSVFVKSRMFSGSVYRGAFRDFVVNSLADCHGSVESMVF